MNIQNKLEIQIWGVIIKSSGWGVVAAFVLASFVIAAGVIFTK